MPVIDLGGNNYPAYADIAAADIVLAADISRAAGWASRTADTKARALITASRLIARLKWASGQAPDPDAPPEAIGEAAAMLAADLAAKPSLAGSLGQESNLKRVKAGSAEVEFKANTAQGTLPMPADIWTLILSTGLIGSSGDDAPFYSGGDFPSRFEDCDHYIDETRRWY